MGAFALTRTRSNISALALRSAGGFSAFALRTPPSAAGGFSAFALKRPAAAKTINFRARANVHLLTRAKRSSDHAFTIGLLFIGTG